MGEATENLKGMGNELAGNTKQVVGEALGDAALQEEGIRQEEKGEAQYEEGDRQDAQGNEI